MKRNVILFLCFAFAFFQAQATHIMGGDLTYECIDPVNRSYKLNLTIYRDCAGITLDTDQQISYASNSCGYPEVFVSLNFEGREDITPVCNSSVQTSCNSNSSESFPGVQKYTFSTIVNLPDNCTDWEFKWVNCCRNEAITNIDIDLVDGTGFTIYAILNNLDAPCNNSPIFTTRPVSFICAQEPFNFNNGSFDKDGDRLEYKMTTPLDYDYILESSPPVTFNSPFTFDKPLDGDFDLNPFNGQIFIQANSIQIYVSTLLVEEYRNGVKIGSVIRELQTLVLDNAFCGDVNIVGVRNVTGGTLLNPDSISVCPETELNFDVLFLANGGSDYQLSTNADLVLENSQVTSQVNDTLMFSVTWTPTIDDLGYHSAVFKIEYCTLDDIRILQAFAINIIVGSDNTNAGPDRLICSNSEPIRIDATGGNSFNWLPTTGIVGSTSNGSSIWVQPNLTNGQSICYTVTSDMSPVYCNNTDMVCITKDDSPNEFVAIDTALCGGYIIINDEVVTSSGVFYDTFARADQCDSIVEFSVYFEPFTQTFVDTFYCTGTTLNIDGFSPISNEGQYIELLQTVNGGCDSLVILNVSRRFTAYYTDQVDLCEGDSILFTNGEYLKSTGAYKDTFQAFNGCDSIYTLNVTIIEHTVDIFTMEDTICKNSSTTLNSYSNGDFLTWGTGESSSSISVQVDSSQYFYATSTLLPNCIRRDSIFILSVEIPLVPDTFILCNNEDGIINLGASPFEFNWSDNTIGNQITINNSTPNPLSVTSTYGDCIASNSIHIERDSIYSWLTVSPNDTIYVSEEVEITANSNQMFNSNWLPNDYFFQVNDNSVNFYASSGETFEVVNESLENGCLDTVSMRIVVLEDIYIPSAFTPNNDNHNDYFTAIGKDIESYNLKIYNVWGELLFESVDLNIGWDGTYKGKPQEMDTYVYHISVKVKERTEKNYSGSILLIR